MGVFLFFGAVMGFLAGATLLWHGSFLDRAWILNPRAYKQLSLLGNAAGIAFLLLGATMAMAGVGWIRRRFWAWVLTVIIIATQVAGNLVNSISGDLLRGGVGLIIAGALLYFLLRPQVRTAFARRAPAGVPSQNI